MTALATGVVTAGPAFAADAISPPSVSPSVVADLKVGTPFTLTFASTTGTASDFEYVLDGGSTKTVAATDGSATLSVTPTRRTTTITVYGVAGDGTVSGGTFEDYLAANDTTAADDDLNGDGKPDLLTVGDTTGLASGLWQALGTDKAGHLSNPATNIGTEGNGVGGTFNGAQAIMGNFDDDGFQDILAYYPTTGDVGGGMVLDGSGDGSALQTQYSGNEVSIESGMLADPVTGDNPTQVANGYDATGLNAYYDGLFATSGDSTNGYVLDYDEAGPIAADFNPIQLTATTPDGTSDWNEWTIATAKVASGVAMYLWNESTGALYLWQGITVTDNGNQTGSLAYAQQYKISADWNKGVALTTLEAADFSGSGTPDLWTVNAAGNAEAYVVSDLSTTTLTGSIKRTHAEQLS